MFNPSVPILLVKYLQGKKSAVYAVESYIFSFNCRQMAGSVSFTDLPEPQVNIGLKSQCCFYDVKRVRTQLLIVK